MITLIILTDSIKIGPLLGIGAFVLLFCIMIYQLSKVEHDAQKWRKLYLDKCDETVELFSQNIDLKATANNLCDKLNDCQLKVIESNSLNIELCEKIDQLNKSENS